MNKNRRASIDATIEQLVGALSAVASIEIEPPKSDIATILDEEQAFFNSLAEDLKAGQGGDALVALDAAMAAMEQAASTTVYLRWHLNVAIGHLKEARA